MKKKPIAYTLANVQMFYPFVSLLNLLSRLIVKIGHAKFGIVCRKYKKKIISTRKGIVIHIYRYIYIIVKGSNARVHWNEFSIKYIKNKYPKIYCLIFCSENWRYIFEQVYAYVVLKRDAAENRKYAHLCRSSCNYFLGKRKYMRILIQFIIWCVIVKLSNQS